MLNQQKIKLMKWNEIVINRFQEHEKNEDQKQVSNKQNNNDNDKYYSDEDPVIEKNDEF